MNYWPVCIRQLLILHWRDLMYGQDARVQSSLDFYQPTNTMEMEFAIELFNNLKQTRRLAQQEIKAQGKQK